MKKSKFLGTECINLFDSLCFQYSHQVLDIFKMYVDYEGMQITNEHLASFLIKKCINL
jgi:hypothetical protein